MNDIYHVLRQDHEDGCDAILKTIGNESDDTSLMRRAMRAKLSVFLLLILRSQTDRMVYIVFLEPVLSIKFKMAAQSGGQDQIENRKSDIF